jgi:glucose-1-phosphate thymidylyltransferase
MRIIVPMAGMGKRMRPHTLSIPKPLIKIAGKPIVQRLVEDIASVTDEKIEEVAFIIGDFGKEIENQLMQVAANVGARGKIYYQLEPLGTAHAILCAKESLEGKVIIAYADTLFKADFSLSEDKDGVIWVHKVDTPEDFGVVKLDANQNITEFYEKPTEFVSDLAIIGIYYFKDGAFLRDELQYLLDNDIKTGGEYGITDGLRNMMEKGLKFSTDSVEEWLDCGNKDATVQTNQRVLIITKDEVLVDNSAIIENSVIKEPCYIGKNARITNAVIGPYVSVGENTIIEHSVISNTIIQSDSRLIHVNLHNSMVGNFVELSGKPADLSIGDYSQIEF